PPVSAPDVSILIANCNGRRHLESCLPSLDALDYPRDRFEVVLVDNGSADDSVAWTREHHPTTRIVSFPRNLGFAPAYNLAAGQARGAFLAFLNNDTRVDPAWLRALVDAAERDHAACAGSLILDWDGTTVDFAGGVTSLAGHAWSDHEHQRADALGELNRALLFACAGSMLVRRSAWDEAGGFDTDYFAYFEDVDLGWRLSLLGHRVVLAPEAVTYHRLHGTSGAWAFSPRLRLYERNALFTVYKCLDDEHLARVLPVALALTLARGLRYSSLPPEQYAFGRATPDVVPVAPQTIATLLAIEEFGTALPALRVKRDAIQRARRVTDQDLWPLLRDPLRIHALGDPYEAAARTLYETFGLGEIVGQGESREGHGEARRGTKETCRADLQVRRDGRALPSTSLRPGKARPDSGAKAPLYTPSGGDAQERDKAGGPGPLPLVSVIVLTALGPKHLPACLDSLAAQTYPADRLEILVVDNGSAEDPADCVRQHAPGARVVPLPANTGFCAGNNAGAREARGTLLVFLNDDTRVDARFVEALVDAAARHQAAAVGVLILSWDGKRIDFAGGGMNFHGKGFQTDVDSADIDRFRTERPILFPCGAAMLIRRDLFLDMGGFDEELFAYYEDLALGWQVWLRGGEVWFAPQAIVYHIHHGTSREWKGSTRLCYERNALINIFKQYDTSTLERVFPVAVILAVERALMWAGLATVAHEHRIPRASKLRRFYWRLKPRAVGRLIKGELTGHGARWNLGAIGSLRAVGAGGLVRTAGALVRFLFTDTQAKLLVRWQYFIERGSQERSFDARPEEVSGASGAILTALD
ncbi:MAG: glycosyltransferase family 2 protein, partial [Acidobacteria bacterium]|nr:glycosyltransferase family 2 protein [Acidobacteriota bacterium]